MTADILTAGEAVVVALGHYEQGARWLDRGEGMPRGDAPGLAAAGSMASAHFAAAQVALAMAALDRETPEDGTHGH